MPQLEEIGIVRASDDGLLRLRVQSQPHDEHVVLAQARATEPAAALRGAPEQAGQRRDGTHTAGAVVGHGERRHDGLGKPHEVALRPGDAGHAVGDLLPTRTVGALPRGPEAVLGDVDDALVAVAEFFYDGGGAVPKGFESAGTIAVEQDVGSGEEGVERGAARGGFEI